MKTDRTANLPTSCFFTARFATPSPGRVITVPAGAKLQGFIDSAVCGETLMLAAGATYENVSGFTLPAKHCDDNHWITIRSNTVDANLPAEGVRMTPCWAKVASLPGRPRFACPAGGVPSSTRLAKLLVRPSETPITISGDHYRLIGLEITRPTGSGAVVDFVQTPRATKIILDRIWMHGTARDETTHGVQLGDGHSIAVIDSYLNDFHCIAGSSGKCSDAQAILGGNDTVGGGTYKIVNNFLEAAAENILFGGGASVDIPGDIEVRRNHLYKPMLWNPADPSFFGTTFTVKNHYEMKNGTRALVEGNIMENTWGGFSQIGAHILLTPKNQTQGRVNLCPNCYVTHVTVRYNHMISGGQGVQIADAPNDNGAYATAGNSDSVHDNLFENLVYKNCYKCTNYYNQIATGISAPSSDILKGVTPARLREADDRKGKSEQLERKSYHAPRSIDRPGELRQQTRRNEFPQPPKPATLGADKQRNQERDQQQSPEPFWCAESHRIANCQLPIADCQTHRQFGIEYLALSVGRLCFTATSSRSFGIIKSAQATSRIRP